MLKPRPEFIDEAARLRGWLIEQAEALAAAFDDAEAAAVLQVVATRCADALKLWKQRDSFAAESRRLLEWILSNGRYYDNGLPAPLFSALTRRAAAVLNLWKSHDEMPEPTATRAQLRAAMLQRLSFTGYLDDKSSDEYARGDATIILKLLDALDMKDPLPRKGS